MGEYTGLSMYHLSTIPLLMKRFGLILLIFSIILLVACSSTEKKVLGQAYEPDLLHGKSLYKHYCGRCHDTGNDAAPGLKDSEEWDLQSLARSGIVKAHEKRQFLTGTNGSELSGEDEADVLHYIKTELSAREDGY